VLECSRFGDGRGYKFMRCQVCGEEYRGEHFCASPVAIGSGTTAAAPKGFALGHYLRLAWRIVLWDDSAVREIMDDPHATLYGLLIWSVSNALSLFVILSFTGLRSSPPPREQIARLVALSLVSSAIWGLVHMGICHLMAKYFCAGQGTFMQIIRPLLLAEIVYLLLAIPVVGSLVAPIAWVAVMVIVFHEVHGIEFLSAFLLSAGVGLALRIVLHFFPHRPF